VKKTILRKPPKPIVHDPKIFGYTEQFEKFLLKRKKQNEKNNNFNFRRYVIDLDGSGLQI